MSVSKHVPGHRRQFPWWVWLIPVFIVGVAVLRSGASTPITLQLQDMNISAPSGAPDPNERCFQIDPAGQYFDFTKSFEESGVTLARIEPAFNSRSGSLGGLSDNAFVRYTDDAVHVVYLDKAQNMKGFRISTTTFKKEIEAGKGSIINRIRRIGANIPASELHVFDTLDAAMQFLNWPGLQCNPM